MFCGDNRIPASPVGVHSTKQSLHCQCVCRFRSVLLAFDEHIFVRDPYTTNVIQEIGKIGKTWRQSEVITW